MFSYYPGIPLVGYINPEAKGYTIGLRADMDALRHSKSIERDRRQTDLFFNDYEQTDCSLQSISKVIGEENIVPMPKKMGSEDFSRYIVEKPGGIYKNRNKKRGKRHLHIGT